MFLALPPPLEAALDEQICHSASGERARGTQAGAAPNARGMTSTETVAMMIPEAAWGPS